MACAYGGDSRGHHHSKGDVVVGCLRGLSNGSCICMQAVTPAKPHGGVVGQMTANAHTGEEGLGGVGVSGRGAGGFDGLAQGN